ncbi:MAG TPA: 5-deoxy-glucuronate isomerase, partial [Ktedonobacteraceae bacterium]
VAGWEYVHLQARRLGAQHAWSYATGDHEMAIVLLSGSIRVDSDRGKWSHIGGRDSVFRGLPFALYLPRNTSLTVSAETACEMAVALAPTDQDHQPRLVTPQDIEVEIRGGDHATRQINNIIPPGFPCHRLVVVEVYTPGGNWSSYPAHKHDVHRTDQEGKVLEADLEEVYFYKLDRPEGFAFQRIYTAPESPLQQAGLPIDAVLLARDNDIVLVPEGYHPVSSPPGYTTYYLNVLAGSAQSLANSEDPRYTWVKESYRSRDPRVPIYDITRRS